MFKSILKIAATIILPIVVSILQEYVTSRERSESQKEDQKE